MHPGFCPQCGERVTPYAAGCALCGADLDPRRWQQPPSFTQRLIARLPLRRRRLGPRAIHSMARPKAR
jgi:predicted amidophosphoribosyltransferase